MGPEMVPTAIVYAEIEMYSGVKLNIAAIEKQQPEFCAVATAALCYHWLLRAAMLSCTPSTGNLVAL